MWLGVLGPVEVHREQASPPVALGTRKHRVLLAALALGVGNVQSVDTLVDYLWGDRPPDGALGTLQSYVSGLRRALGTATGPGEGAPLRTANGGYVLDAPSVQVDAATTTALLQRAHRALGPLARDAIPGSGVVPDDVLERIGQDLEAAVASWRGRAYDDLGDHPQAVAERARLDELRLVGLEDLAVVRLARGEHATVAAELEALTSQHPLRERLWTLRAVALARTGRQADALEVVSLLARTLDEELGLQPTALVRDTQTAILRQDPLLTWSEQGLTRSGVAVGEATAPAVPVASVTAPAVPMAPAGPTAPAGPAEPTAGGMRPDAGTPRLPAWPMVGRDHEVAVLRSRLDAADAGVPQFAVVTGEPGIGKSRLVAELMATARGRGARVLVGRCSSDAGAPPLWPWQAVLDGLGSTVPVADRERDPDPDSGRFAAWDHICREILTAAADRTIVVALDDLQWADPSSLRVLRHLAALAEHGRLLLLVTLRSHPEPAGQVAETLEALARRHAATLRLHGLSVPDTGAVLNALGDRPVSVRAAEAMRDRTDGNPFFVVEYARLLQSEGAVDAEPPTAVADVVRRRLDAVGEPTLEVLRYAAVVGRRFDLTTVTACTGQSDLAVLDRLEQATAAGLLRDEGDDRFRFSHALVRDAVYGALSPSRRQRMHARIAETLSADRRASAQIAQVARHWAEAGSAHAAQAWTAAYRAALAAQRLHGHEEAADLLDLALTRIDLDPDATPADRYELLLALADAERWAARWDALTDAVVEAIGVAEEIGDPALLARAAVATTRGALWQTRSFGATNDALVAALRRSLETLPPEDSALRSTVLISLANETYYTATEDERQQLVADGLAMARRLGDDALLMESYAAAFLAVWHPWTARQRRELADEVVAIARARGDARGEAMGLAHRATALSELGQVTAMETDLAQGRRLAEELQLAYPRWYLDCMRLPWLAMRGSLDEARGCLDGLVAAADAVAVPHRDDAIAALGLVIGIWSRESGPGEFSVEALAEFVRDAEVPIRMTIVGFLVRLDRLDEARELFPAAVADADDESWFAPLVWGFAAEAALALDEPELAALVYRRLQGLAGGVLSGGSTIAMGPVDAFLALAAAATGEHARARGHAEDALELIRDWDLPLVEEWLLAQRDAHGF
ncbi:transcriptional regulator [Mumia flava]|uniref:Transcriptional regulator n=1 Tax=Mumia flava TaxID=1348852 RepID=A0A0B2BP16_9ACTN|nr:BTAD domain-containing putative transcriptional regulator [Mumia flava]PJJ57164.1 transcriptional regulator [Mumia flava]